MPPPPPRPPPNCTPQHPVLKVGSAPWRSFEVYVPLTSRDASEGKGPRRRLDRRLEEVAKAVGGGCCRSRMPLKLALAVMETVAGHSLGALGGGGSPPSNASLPTSPRAGVVSQVEPPPKWDNTTTRALQRLWPAIERHVLRQGGAARAARSGIRCRAAVPPESPPCHCLPACPPSHSVRVLVLVQGLQARHKPPAL